MVTRKDAKGQRRKESSIRNHETAYGFLCVLNEYKKQPNKQEKTKIKDLYTWRLCVRFHAPEAGDQHLV